MLVIEKDKDKMRNYHRCKDMINLIDYFPELSPIVDLTIVKDYKDYLDNYDVTSKLLCTRNDTLITKPSMKSVETKGIKDNVEEIFKKIKEIDKDGVLVLFNLNHEPSQRYNRYAGIAVSVSLGNEIIIEAVGKGFDGREVSKGICTHERYCIPWYEIRNVSIGNFKKYNTYLIKDEEYKNTRNDRINFLKSVIHNEDVEKYIPEKYNEIPDFIWMDVIKNVIKKLEKMEDELKNYNMNEFSISGHTEGKRYLPWQMFDKSRYLRSNHE